MKQRNLLIGDIGGTNARFALANHHFPGFHDVVELKCADFKTSGDAIRHYLGGYMTVLGGADAIVFTGGIGENSRRVRADVCRNMEWAGVHLDDSRNQEAGGEGRISTDDSPVQIWVVPTNEEIVVARQTVAAVESKV